jgi:hypothetical protein
LDVRRLFPVSPRIENKNTLPKNCDINDPTCFLIGQFLDRVPGERMRRHVSDTKVDELAKT